MIYLIRAPQYEGRPEKKLADWIVASWKRHGVVFKDVGDIMKGPIKHGVFYDDEDSVRNYAKLFLKVVGSLKSGDKLLFIEGWNVSLPSYKLYIDSMGLDVKMFGLFPSSVKIPGEYFREFPWAYPFEETLYKCLDKIFLQTPYAQSLINIPNGVVTGLPLPEGLGFKDNPKNRDNIVVFSHRWGSDKHPEIFERLANKFKDEAEFWLLTPRKEVVKNKNIKVVVNKNRREYLKNLRKAKIVFSSAELETFGFSIAEGVLVGCCPLLINRACYPDMYNKEFLYSDDKEMFEKFSKFIKGEWVSDPREKLDWFNDSANRMLKEIL